MEINGGEEGEKKMGKTKQKVEIEQVSLAQDAEKLQLFNDDRVTFKLPASVKSKFLELAKGKCINISQVLRVAVDDFIKENQ